ncbi:hypothetical protein EYF80_036433 [Liparis tanakae]|uniref:Uncharacterized protein n=1 Tax=Liparis tanakae TaxID=230148 RepID=A0A4Z2GIT7_9TELE|nr:hypothetical protein EYF80_036433 [Liparis tanakae]
MNSGSGVPSCSITLFHWSMSGVAGLEPERTAAGFLRYLGLRVEQSKRRAEGQKDTTLRKERRTSAGSILQVYEVNDKRSNDGVAVKKLIYETRMNQSVHRTHLVPGEPTWFQENPPGSWRTHLVPGEPTWQPSQKPSKRPTRERRIPNNKI